MTKASPDGGAMQINIKISTLSANHNDTARTNYLIDDGIDKFPQILLKPLSFSLVFYLVTNT